MRGRGLVEGKRSVDDRLDGAAFEQRPHFPAQREGDFSFFGGTAWTKGGTGNRQTSTKYAAEVDGRAVAAHEADDDQAAFDGEPDEIASDVLASDDIENDVDTAAAGDLLDHVHEIFRAVVDGALRAKLLTGTAFVVGTGGREHAGAARRGQLDGGCADTARAAVEQRRFAGAEPAAIEDIRPDREKRFGDGRRGHQVHPFRNRQTLHGRGRAQRRVTATREQGADAVADAPIGDATANRVDGAGDLEARQVARSCRRWIRAATLQDVGTVDTRGRDSDPYFSRRGSRI